MQVMTNLKHLKCELTQVTKVYIYIYIVHTKPNVRLNTHHIVEVSNIKHGGECVNVKLIECRKRNIQKQRGIPLLAPLRGPVLVAYFFF